MLSEMIVNGLYVIPIGMVNTFLLESNDGLVLIDTGFPNSKNIIFEALSELGYKPSDICHLIVTHAHPDHIGSAGAIKTATNAKVYMHPVDAPIAERGTGIRPVFAAPGELNRKTMKLYIGKIKTFDPVSIDHLVEDGEVLPIAGGLIVIHIPGQSAGQIALFWPKNDGVLFVADACLYRKRLAYATVYEDIEIAKQSLRKLSKLQFAIACFGHGKTLTKDATSKFRKRWMR